VKRSDDYQTWARNAAHPTRRTVTTQAKAPTIKLLQGNESCAEAAIAAGCRFFGGYPISPSSEIAEHMSSLLPRVGGRFIQMEDEIAAMGCVLGAAMTGAKAMTATSGPGYSLKQRTSATPS
jgi:2-oxoglutarate ferredoxin oxidoreductase subunit alpha